MSIKPSFCKKRNDIIQNISSKIRKGNHNLCITKKCRLDRILKISERIGSGSINGEALKANIKLKTNMKLKTNQNVAIKRAPMTYTDWLYIKNPVSTKALNTSTVWSELLMLRLCDFLVKNNICCNLPWYYKYYLCKKCNYFNEELKDKIGGKCIMFVNELADGDFKNYVLHMKPSIIDLMIAYLQIFIGVYCLRKYFNIWHHDLHYGNILFQKISKNKDEAIEYIINGNKLVVPNNGVLMTIFDFGYARIPDKIEPDKLKFIYDKETSPLEDFSRISTMLFKDEEQTNDLYDKFGRYLTTIIQETIDNKKVSKTGVIEMENVIITLYNDLKYVLKSNKVKLKATCSFNTDKKLSTNNKTIKKYLLL